MSLQTQQANAGQNVPSSPSGVDNLTCQWQGCTQPNHASPEKLYEHVCETHIGRKSTNNLNLQCFWGSCRTTTVKRDHITSHIRVHVPLKPHKCDFCGKSFKRPQDLKKHIKTHADESVLLNSPQAGGGRSQPNGYHGQNNIKSSGFYGDGGMGGHMGYPTGYPNMQGGYNHFAAAGAPQVGMHGQNYGGAHYGVPQMSSYGGSGLTESRKRTHDALNDFFGDIKRRNIDAGQFQDFGARFGNYFNMMGPGGFNGFNQGYGGGMDAGGGLAYQAAQHPPMMMNPGYNNMQFSELRTKNDLLSIDQFLEQLQNTAFDNPNTDTMMSMGNMQQPAMAAQLQSRGSHSPSRMHASAATPGAYSTASLAASSTHTEDTPGLTPSSFQASHSPSSSHQNMSPSSRPAGGVGYPTLPSISALENQTNQFAQGPAGGAPPAGLGSHYEEYDGRRRFSAGMLQRAQRDSPPASRESEKAASPSLREAGDKTEGKGADNASSPSQADLKLPSVAQITGEGPERQAESRSEGQESPRTRNVRMIQNLKQYIRARLEKGEYESSNAGSGKSTPRAQPEEDTEMMDADADDRSSGEGSTPKRTGPAIAYPNLET